MFNMAIKWGFLNALNPAAGVDFFPETKRERFYTLDELRRLSESLMSEPEHWRAFFALTLMLGTRKNELLSARWEYVDFEARTLRLPKTKSGHAETKILTIDAVQILRSLPKGENRWIFPSLRPNRAQVGHMTGAQQ